MLQPLEAFGGRRPAAAGRAKGGPSTGSESRRARRELPQGTLARFGLSHEQLKQANPRLIYCSICGFVRTGLRAAEPGYDFAIQTESG